MSIEHDALYARAWECEYKRPTFDAENDNATPTNSPESAVKSDLSTEETWNTPRNARERSRENLPQTDTYHRMEPDAETSSEKPDKSPTKPCSLN